MTTWKDILETSDNYIYNSDNGEELYEELCQNSKPSDFYFYVHKGPPEQDVCTDISIVPKQFFNVTDGMYDQFMDLSHILPEYCEDFEEAMWSCSKDIKKVRKDLLKLGFEENEKFNKCCERDYWNGCDW